MTTFNERIADLMEEVNSVATDMPESTLQRDLMIDAHRALSLAHSLIYAVNSIQLAALLNKNGN